MADPATAQADPQAARTANLDQQVCFALYAATNVTLRAYRPLLDELGLTYPQYLVMLVLWHEGQSSVGQLAERLHLTPHAVSPLVERLVSAALVTRCRDHIDRRVAQVNLTPAGRALEPSAAEAQRKIGCRTGLDDDSAVLLRGQLQDLAQHIAASAVAAD